MSIVVSLSRKPAYTPMGPPAACMTPGHDRFEARLYPGGWLCDRCIGAAMRAYKPSSGNGGAS